MECIKLGVIGVGRIGRLHVENICYRIPGAEVTTITDINKTAAQETAEKFQIPSVVDTYQEVLNSADVDAVVICSSTDTHAEIIEAAAKAKKHIFCEKPVDTDLKRIYETMKVVRENKVLFQIGFNRRFDHNHSVI